MAWERFWNGGFLLGMRFIACMVLLSGRASFVLGEEGVRGVKAENWVQWRGPTADGIASPTANPPLQWDSKTNIAWVADLPGQGTSTPIIWDDQVFVLSAEKTSRKSLTPVENDERAKTVPDEFFHRFLVTSIDRVTGKMRWQKLATEQVPHEGRHMTNTYAAGSPTTDGERLYVSFGSRGIFCYTLTGDLVWQVDLGDMRTRFGWGEAVTPVLAGDLLIVNWDQEEGSFIIALDKRTGKSVWKVDRPEEVTSWNTPLVTTHDGKQMVIVNGTGSAKAYDAQTGEQIWACGGQTINAIPSPIRFEDTAICMSGYRAACAVAVPLGSHGDITGKRLVRWQVAQGTPYVPSPIISRNRLFFTAGNTDVLSCIDARTGKTLFERKRVTGVGSLYASPMIANGHLYFVGREGTTVVLKDNESLDVAAVNTLDDAIDASPVAVHDQLFLRSWTKLYCIQTSPKAAIQESPKASAKTSANGASNANVPTLFSVDLETTSETSANASMGDLDGDGDLDIVLAKGRHWPLHNRLLFNNGTGEFTVAKNLSDKPDRTYSAVLADLDRDGDLDILVSNDSPDAKFVYLNDGKANFKVAGTWGEPTWNTRNAAVADLNGDGYPDVIAANRRSASYVCLNDGAGNFRNDRVITIPSESATTIVPADFYGDGFIDLAVPHRDGGQSMIHFNDGKANFFKMEPVGRAKSSARTAAAGDLNRDGFIDLVMGDEKQGSVVYLNDGNGKFGEGMTIGEKTVAPCSIAVGDMNRDGKADIVIGYALTQGSIHLNDGSGRRFDQIRFGDGMGSAYGIALGDVDSNGDLDIVVGRSDAPNTIYYAKR